MRFVFDQDLHIHSTLSRCCKDPLQTPENILAYAKRNNLHTICLTDHYWDSAVEGASPWYQKQNFDHIKQSLPLPQTEGVRFLFGCEGEMDCNMTLSVPPERYGDFDFIVIPTTHMHMPLVCGEEDDGTPAFRAHLWVKRLDALLQKDLPFHKIGIAHLTCTLMMAKKTREEYLQVLNLIPTSDMERLFAKAAELGVGIELNLDDLQVTDEEADRALRMFRIAKEKGCKFYFATDSHSQEWFERAPAVAERIIDLLGLEASDQFIL